MARGEAERNANGEIVGLQGTVQDITERKRMDEALSISERNLHESQKIGRMGSYQHDLSDETWVSSPVMDEIFDIGADYPRTLGDWMQILHPTEREPINSYFRKIIAEHRRFEREYRIVRVNDGSERWVLDVGNVEYDANGVALRMVGIVQDVTQRKLVEEALMKSEANYRHLINSLPDIVYSFDLEKGGAFYSPTTQSVLGYSPEHLLEHPMCWHNSIHPDDLPQVETAIENFKAGIPFNIDYRFFHADGHWIWTNERSIDLPNSESKPLRIGGIARDITAIKKTEEILLLTRFAFEHSSDGIFWMTSDARIVDANEAACRSLGYSRDELLKLAIPDIDPLVNYDIRRQLYANIELNGSMTSETIHTTKNGNKLFIEIVANFIPFGSEKRICTIVRNITERKQAEEVLKKYARHLIVLEEDLRKRIAADLHDDIAQVLAALGLNLAHLGTLLKDEPRNRLSPTLEDSRELAKKASHSVRNLMVDLHPFQLEEFGLVATITSNGKQYPIRTGIKVSVNADPKFPRLPAKKETALFRITQEALQNVAKHAAATNVTISLEKVGRFARLTITDDGAGFVPQAPSHLPEGCGWGLTNMRERAELTGGSFRVNSSPGLGTTIAVEVQIPLKQKSR